MACIFCEIGKGNLNCYPIHEDESTKSFLDIRPIRPGHLLVIPKHHVSSIHDLEENDYIKLMTTVQRMSKRIDETINPKKVGIAVAGFDIDHLHIHVVPMLEYHDITSHKYLNQENLEANEKDLSEMAEMLRTE